MKLTKRMQNAMIQAFIANVLFFLIFVSLIVFYIYPQYKNIQALKWELQSLSATTQEISKKGISFADFKTAVGEFIQQQDPFFSNILLKVEKTFYDTYFQNTTEATFEDNIKKIEKEIVEVKSSQSYKDANALVDTVLPFYSQNAWTEEVKGVNDFYFINYIENLLYTFNLKSAGSIGVGELMKYVNDAQSNSPQAAEQIQNDLLSEDIYIIPLSFDIVGQKADIIDFIHFFQNVGSLKLEEGKLNVYKDNLINKTLDGKEGGWDYNIYKNQIAVIDTLSLVEYPDSSTFSNSTTYTPLVNLIKTFQAKEKYAATLSVHFYVSGIPLYKIQQQALTLQQDIDNLLQLLEQEEGKLNQGSTTVDTYIQQEKLGALSSLKKPLDLLKTEVDTLNASLVPENLNNQTYEQVSQYRKNFLRVKDVFESTLNTSLEK